mmetsp:Transcript_39/g.67  ORF Transcript_39/g.67 Transcript_39/m.67 type:complete len:803 (+) Transcript_39:67-2475(+)
MVQSYRSFSKGPSNSKLKSQTSLNRTSTKSNLKLGSKSSFRQSRKSKKSRRSSVSSRMKQNNNDFVVIDPLDESNKTPLSLTRDKRKDKNKDSQAFSRHQSFMKSGNSFNSGRISPTGSDASDAVSVTFSSFRIDQSVVSSEHRASRTEANSSPGSTVYSAEERFLFNSPAHGFDASSRADESHLSHSETQSYLGDMDGEQDIEQLEEYQDLDEDSEEEGEKEEELTERELKILMNSDFEINLKETETIFLFEKLDETVANYDDDHDAIEKRNKEFLQFRQKKIDNPDNYQTRNMQTVPSFMKNKYTDIQKKTTVSTGVSVSAWQIFDEYEALRIKEEKEREEREQLALGTTKDEEDDDEEEVEADDDESVQDGAQSQMQGSVRSSAASKSSALKKPEFHQKLQVIERIIVQNKMSDKQAEYKTFEDTASDQLLSRTEKVSSSLTAKPGTLKTLWKYECPAVQGKDVNCMSWNYKNQDMLAVGYGNVAYSETQHTKEGHIAIWMLKNPTFPERLIKVDNRAVSSCDFSRENPNLLSVGYNDGTVAIFDIRTRSHAPVLETSKHHTGTVWDLQWVDRGKDIGERLHSVGVDGRINSWSIKKGLECQEIMRLKRMRSSGTGYEGVISRESGAMCIDFDPSDSNLYIVGSEDGAIYKCSCSYNEQTLQNYVGHTGPVYRVKWNPKNKDTFISCSADWTIRIWDTSKRGLTQPPLKIEPFSNKKDKRSSIITDVQWSPYNDRMFASTSITGDVEIWDINFSTLKPRFSKSEPGIQYNCLLYANDSPAVLVGDNNGCIEVLKPVGLY